MQSQRLTEISNEIERLNRLHTEAKQKGRTDMAIEFKTQGEQYAEKLKVLSALPTVSVVEVEKKIEELNKQKNDAHTKGGYIGARSLGQQISVLEAELKELKKKESPSTRKVQFNADPSPKPPRPTRPPSMAPSSFAMSTSFATQPRTVSAVSIAKTYQESQAQANPAQARSVSAFAINKMYSADKTTISPPMARKAPAAPTSPLPAQPNSKTSPTMTRKTPVSPNLNSLLSPTAMQKALNKIPPMPRSEPQPISGSFLVLAPQAKVTQNSPPTRPLPETPKKQKPRPETTYYTTPVHAPTETNSSFIAEPDPQPEPETPQPKVSTEVDNRRLSRSRSQTTPRTNEEVAARPPRPPRPFASAMISPEDTERLKIAAELQDSTKNLEDLKSRRENIEDILKDITSTVETMHQDLYEIQQQQQELAKFIAKFGVDVN